MINNENILVELCNLQVAQEWIIFLFRADGCAGTVAWEYFRFVWQRQQPELDGVDDLVVVAAGQVGASNAAGKEGVSSDQQLEGSKVQAD
jgi:hypothetical protein